MNENKKNNLSAIVIVILAALLIFCFVRIRKLEGQISRLDNAMHNQYQQIMNEVGAIYNNVDQKLREEASLLSRVEAEYGEINLDTRTIDITVTVVPKLISEDMKVRVSIKGRSADLMRDGNFFSGTIPVDIFNEGEQMLLSIETAAGIQNQYIPEVRVDYFWQEYIPALYYCDISGSGTFTEGKYTLNASLDINCSPVKETPNVTFEKFVLVTELNGQEINREDITEDVMNYEAYPHGVYFRDEYTMECEAREGDELAIYVEATDSVGFLHRRLLHYWKEENGAVAEPFDGTEYIYAPNGTLVFP